MNVSFVYNSVSYYSIVSVQALNVSISNITVDGLGLGMANAGIGYRNAEGVVRNVVVQGIDNNSNNFGDYSGIIVFIDNYSSVNFQLMDFTLTGSYDSEITIGSSYVNAVLTGNLFKAVQSGSPQYGVRALDGAVNTISSCQFSCYSMGGMDPTGAISAGVRSISSEVTVVNSIFSLCDVGVLVSSGATTVIGSTFLGDLFGVAIDSSFAVVNDNKMTGSIYAVYAYANSGVGTHTSMNFNDITGNSFAIYINDNDGMVSVDARYNNISDNGVGAYNDLSDPINMLYNWWGTATGP